MAGRTAADAVISAALEKRLDPRRLPGSMCRKKDGVWLHYVRKATGEPMKYADLCRNVDHDGAEPWLPQRCCCGRSH